METKTALVRIHATTAEALKGLKFFRMETYDEVICRLIEFYRDNQRDKNGKNK